MMAAYLTVFFKKSTGEILRTETNMYVKSRKQVREMFPDFHQDVGVTYLPGVTELVGEGWKVVYVGGGKVDVRCGDRSLKDQAVWEEARRLIEGKDVVDVLLEGGMGDYCLEMDALVAARKEWPNKRFRVYGRGERLELLRFVKNTGHIEFVLDKVPSEEYVDMRKITNMNYYRPPAGKAYTYMILLGSFLMPPLCRIEFPGAMVAKALEYRAKALDGKKFLVGLHFQSGQPPNAKSVPLCVASRILDRLLAMQDVRVVFFGGCGDFVPKEKEVLDWTCRDWVDVALMLSVCDCVVAIDSAIMHLALRLRKKVVSLWGPTSPEWILPKSADHTAIAGHCEKRPCGRYECADRKCMKTLEVDKTVRSVLGCIYGKSDF